MFQTSAEAKPKAARSWLFFHSCYFLLLVSLTPDILTGSLLACVGLSPHGSPSLTSPQSGREAGAWARWWVLPHRPGPHHVLPHLGAGSRGQACSRFSLPCSSSPHDSWVPRQSISTSYQHLQAEDPLLSAGKQTQSEVGVLTQHAPF